MGGGGGGERARPNGAGRSKLMQEASNDDGRLLHATFPVFAFLFSTQSVNWQSTSVDIIDCTLPSHIGVSVIRPT